MFNKTIKVDRANDIRFGTTEKSFDSTYGQIITLLRNNKCEQIFCQQDDEGFHQIGFTLKMKPYLINIPKVYVRSVYNDRIGIRVVYYLIEIILSLAKEGLIDPDTLLLGTRLVHDKDGKMKTVTQEILPQLEQQQLLLIGKGGDSK